MILQKYFWTKVCVPTACVHILDNPKHAVILYGSEKASNAQKKRGLVEIFQNINMSKKDYIHGYNTCRVECTVPSFVGY